MSEVIESLKEAINGESNAKRKYELFAEKAKQENLPEIAYLFKATAFAESIHIKNHLKALTTITGSDANPQDFVKVDEAELKGYVKDTASDLLNAIAGEMFEFKKMYKNFVKLAKKAGKDTAELSFTLARYAEQVHARLYSIVLKKLESGKPREIKEIYVCKICGNVELNRIPGKCPVCDHGPNFYVKIDM